MPTQSALKPLGYSQLTRIGHFAGSAADMPLKKMAELAASSNAMNDMFQPVLDEAKIASPLLRAVVKSDVNTIIQLVEATPASVFLKGEIRDGAAVFYNVSAYQLMIFLSKQEMLTQVMALVPPTVNISTNSGVNELEKKAWMEKQAAQLRQGGADLVKLDRDPTTIPFQAIISQNGSSLIENPNAIIYYKDAEDQAHWYIANRDTQTVVRIEPKANSPVAQTTLDSLEQEMNFMSNNTARRSSDHEHAIIKQTMGYGLTRNGIQYELYGISYHDTRMISMKNNEGRSPLYLLCNNFQGRQLIQGYLSSISSTGTSPLFFLCAHPQGRQLIQRNWGSFSSTLTPALLTNSLMQNM
jgi:hypothetical protein